jgi:hypothetical protein
MEIADHAVAAVEYLAAGRAFHKYSWLRHMPLRNVSGNYRGIVADPRWKSAYEICGRTGKYLAGALLLAVFARNVARAHREIAAIHSSQDPWGVKGSRLCCQVSAIMVRTLADGTVSGIHTALTAAKQARFVSKLVTDGDLTHPTMTQVAMDFAATRLDTWVDTFADGDDVYTFVRLHFGG